MQKIRYQLSPLNSRNPTLPKGRKNPWIGCSISLARIPTDARIHIVKAATPSPSEQVREQFKRIKPLKVLPVEKRGWMLDVLTAVRSLGKQEFSNQDVYALVPHFAKLHPNNRHITDKIRQQLQDLCRAKLLSHVDRGIWRLT